MPDRHDPAREIARYIESLPSHTTLPENWLSETHGEMDQPLYDDRRRFRRFRCRGENTTAALRVRHSLPAINRPESWHKVYMCDLSRSGVGFLHSEVLFPHESQQLMLPDGRKLEIEIARCTRIQDRCFQVGARLQRIR